VIIDHGRVVAEDAPENLARAMRGGERLAITVEGPLEPLIPQLEALPGVAAVSRAPANGQGPEIGNLFVQTGRGDESAARAVRRAVAEAVVRSGCGLLELTAERLTLEEVFVRLVTTEER